MAKVIVTGANGFLGSWLTKKLIADGHEVFALVRKSSDLSELKGIACKYLYGDVTDLESLKENFKEMDAVFHLAGLIAYKKSQREMMEKVNVQGTANVISACQVNKTPRLIYISSVVAIGAGFTSNDVLNEESTYNIKELNLGYFETKRMAEELVVAATKKGLIDSVILNPSTIYGFGDAKKGSRKMQLKVAQGKLKFYTAGGVNVVAVEDVVDGIIKAWKLGRKGERYILAGENILIKDLFAMIAKEAGQTPPSVQVPTALLHIVGSIGDGMEVLGLKGPLSKENAYTSTMFHWFDASKAKRELGFHPRPASEAIKNSVTWIKNNDLL